MPPARSSGVQGQRLLGKSFNPGPHTGLSKLAMVTGAHTHRPIQIYLCVHIYIYIYIYIYTYVYVHKYTGICMHA